MAKYPQEIYFQRETKRTASLYVQTHVLRQKLKGKVQFT